MYVIYKAHYTSQKAKSARINNFDVYYRGKLTELKIHKLIEDFKAYIIDEEALYLVDLTEYFPENKEITCYKYYGGMFAIPPSTYKVDRENSFTITRKTSSLSDLIEAIKEQSLVIIAVKDEATEHMPEFFSMSLDSTYGTHLRSLGYTQSYFAIFSNGKLLHEDIGTDKAVEIAKKIGENDIRVKSAGYNFGDVASIKINELDLSINHRGLNVVILERENVLSTLNFDTHAESIPKSVEIHQAVRE